MRPVYKSTYALLLLVCLTSGGHSAKAAIPVIDFGAIVQLITQVQTLQQQLETARSQLTQAERQLSAMTGGRGMEQLLSNSRRNYLPSTWVGLEQVFSGASGSFGALSSSVQALVNVNAILSSREISLLSPTQRTQLEGLRRSVALAQATAREALSTTSDRFASLQELIEAIGSASDPKAIQDLQARIAAEQGMLQNESIKLDLLERSMRADDAARQQKLREQAIADVGSLRRLAPLGL